MVIKFFMVAAYFMHLKYDNAIFTKFIVAGLVLAYPVYGIFAFSADWLPGWVGRPALRTPPSCPRS